MTSEQGFVSKTIKLSQNIIEQPVLKIDWLTQNILAKDLLETTKAHCEQLKIEALEQITASKTAAAQEVMASANALLSHWQSEKEKQLKALLPQLSELLCEALEKLLVTAPQQDLINTLLKQLIQTKGQATQARLFCHPDRKSQLEQSVNTHNTNLWQVLPDNALAQDALRLEDEQGQYEASLTLSLDTVRQVFRTPLS